MKLVVNIEKRHLIFFSVLLVFALGAFAIANSDLYIDGTPISGVGHEDLFVDNIYPWDISDNTPDVHIKSSALYLDGFDGSSPELRFFDYEGGIAKISWDGDNLKFCEGEDCNTLDDLTSSGSGDGGGLIDYEVGTIFVSAQKYKGNLWRADCQTLAMGADLAGSWGILIRDDDYNIESLLDNYGIPGNTIFSNTCYPQEVIYNNLNDLVNNNVDASNPINCNQHGNQITEDFSVWIGDVNGNINCDNWASNNYMDYGRVGIPNNLNRLFDSMGNSACSASARIYCIKVS